MSVVKLPTAGESSRYARPSLRWIIRRARRIQRFYNVSRRLAIHDARLDYIEFTGMHPGPPAIVLPLGVGSPA